ncbi:MAG: hypothetical protein Greene101449_340 [Candidatus Peregrinibacteria bacterium Greene1014_49]|nr:MAG: hypothetical protein Greene101449_340 [Candidatus Peregrinibacteria bacterium Greene1014_49]
MRRTHWTPAFVLIAAVLAIVGISFSTQANTSNATNITASSENVLTTNEAGPTNSATIAVNVATRATNDADATAALSDATNAADEATLTTQKSDRAEVIAPKIAVANTSIQEGNATAKEEAPTSGAK